MIPATILAIRKSTFFSTAVAEAIAADFDENQVKVIEKLEANVTAASNLSSDDPTKTNKLNIANSQLRQVVTEVIQAIRQENKFALIAAE